MSFLARFFRGRQYERDKPSSSVTINLTVEGSVVSEQDLAQRIVEIVGRYDLSCEGPLTLDSSTGCQRITAAELAGETRMPAAATCDAELVRRLGWTWQQLTDTPEWLRQAIWDLLKNRPDDGSAAAVPA